MPAGRCSTPVSCKPSGRVARGGEDDAGAAVPLEATFLAMFRDEWRLARGESSPLTRIAIVDTRPAEQYLAPEFELFRVLFETQRHRGAGRRPGRAVLRRRTADLSGQGVDLVYNRLTDFALAEPQHAALRAAYLADAVVLTPHPRTHALFADKRNLLALGDDRWLARDRFRARTNANSWRATIPRTVEVLAEDAEAFWGSRKQWFFKPVAGFGSKAAYRGDKLTRRVFAELARGGYVAQAVVSPSERRLLVDGVEQDFKLDLRNYVYRGRCSSSRRACTGGRRPTFARRAAVLRRSFRFLSRCRSAADEICSALPATPAGKTTLLERMLPAMIGQDLRVSVIKHAHHNFDIDRPGKDSFRHRQAGLAKCCWPSASRWVLMNELRGAPEPSLAEYVGPFFAL
jgi:hypothetical protein